MTELEFRLLGPTEIIHNGRPLATPATKHRTLLAALLLRPGRSVSVAELTAELWDEPPRNPRNAVQTYIRRLRATLPEPVLRTTATGYLAEVPPGAVDLHRFRALTEAAVTETDPRAEAAALRAALALWRGPALSDIPSPGLRQAVATLESERLAALERRIELDLRLGGHTELIAELQQLTARDPLRERFWAQLMLALARAGRQAEALRTFQTATATLNRLLGIRPSAELAALHQAILTETLPQPTPPAPCSRALPIHQLPLDSNDFVGREELVAALTTAPPGTTVIYGQPGVGKTALAVHIGHRLKEQYPDGQLYVDLRGYSPGEKPAPTAVLARFLRAFGRAESEIPAEEAERAALYQSLLGAGRFLVLLDNAADAATVAPLVPTGPGCRTLITSRGVLPGLPECRRVTLDVLSPAESRTLLTRALGADLVAAHPAEADRLAELCARLPLALRVAAANLAGLPSPDLPDYLRRLEHSDRLGELSIEDDQDTAVRRAIDSSYRALSAPARRMFRLLSVAPGADVSAPAATALAGADAPAALRQLTEAHLLGEYRPGRYRYHDLLRLYAAERHRAEDSPAERVAAEDRLLRHCLATTAQLVTAMYGPRTDTALDDWTPPRTEFRLPSPAAGVAWFDTEFGSLTAVHARAVERAPESAALLGIALLRVLHVQYRQDEQTEIAHRTLRAAELAGNRRAAGDALAALSEATLWHGDYAGSVRLAALARIHYRAVGLPVGESIVLTRIGHARGLAGQLLRCHACLLRAHELAIAADAPLSQANALAHLAGATMRMGRLGESSERAAASLALFAEIGAVGMHSLYLTDEGARHLQLGRPDLAVRSLRRVQEERRRLGFLAEDGVASGLLAEAYAQLGDHDNTHAVLALMRADPSPAHRLMGTPHVRLIEGILEHRRGRSREALPHLHAAIELAEPLGKYLDQITALLWLALVHLDLGEPGPAREHAAEAVRRARRIPHLVLTARALFALASAEAAVGDRAAAIEHAHHALPAFKEIGDVAGAEQARALLAELEADQPSR